MKRVVFFVVPDIAQDPRAVRLFHALCSAISQIEVKSNLRFFIATTDKSANKYPVQPDGTEADGPLDRPAVYDNLNVQFFQDQDAQDFSAETLTVVGFGCTTLGTILYIAERLKRRFHSTEVSYLTDQIFDQVDLQSALNTNVNIINPFPLQPSEKSERIQRRCQEWFLTTSSELKIPPYTPPSPVQVAGAATSPQPARLSKLTRSVKALFSRQPAILTPTSPSDTLPPITIPYGYPSESLKKELYNCMYWSTRPVAAAITSPFVLVEFAPESTDLTKERQADKAKRAYQDGAALAAILMKPGTNLVIYSCQPYDTASVKAFQEGYCNAQKSHGFEIEIKRVGKNPEASGIPSDFNAVAFSRYSTCEGIILNGGTYAEIEKVLPKVDNHAVFLATFLSALDLDPESDSTPAKFTKLTDQGLSAFSAPAPSPPTYSAKLSLQANTQLKLAHTMPAKMDPTYYLLAQLELSSVPLGAVQEVTAEKPRKVVRFSGPLAQPAEADTMDVASAKSDKRPAPANSHV